MVLIAEDLIGGVKAREGCDVLLLLYIHTYLASLVNSTWIKWIFFGGFFFENANLSYFIRWAKRLRVRFFQGERGKAYFGLQRLFHGDENKSGTPECGRVIPISLVCTCTYVHTYLGISC